MAFVILCIFGELIIDLGAEGIRCIEGAIDFDVTLIAANGRLAW